MRPALHVLLVPLPGYDSDFDSRPGVSLRSTPG